MLPWLSSKCSFSEKKIVSTIQMEPNYHFSGAELVPSLLIYLVQIFFILQMEFAQASANQ